MRMCCIKYSYSVINIDWKTFRHHQMVRINFSASCIDSAIENLFHSHILHKNLHSYSSSRHPNESYTLENQIVVNDDDRYRWVSSIQSIQMHPGQRSIQRSAAKRFTDSKLQTAIIPV